MKSDPSRDDLVPITVHVTPDQEAWLRAVARASGQTIDHLVRQGIQVLRRTSSYRLEGPLRP